MGAQAIVQETLRGCRVSNQVRCQLMALAEGKGELLTHEEKAWSSITFAGTRHEVELTFKGIEAVEAGERYADALPEHEFRISGQLVADATVREVEHRFGDPETLRVAVTLLLLEET